MAVKSKSPLGSISGTIGDIVIRRRFGKEIVCRRPNSYKKSKSKKAVACRSNFADASALAGIVNLNQLLSGIWKDSELEGTDAYHKIIKYNLKSAPAVDWKKQFDIVPPGIQPTGSRIEIVSAKIFVSTAIKSNIPSGSISIFLLISFSKSSGAPDPFLLCSKRVRSENNRLKGVLSPGTKKLLEIKNYGGCRFHASFVFLDNQNRPSAWISTISAKFSLQDSRNL